jgi:ferredoxin
MSIQLLKTHAQDLLSSGKVSCLIGYEVGPRKRTRPAFIYQEEDVDRLVWNQKCTHNLVVYLTEKIQKPEDRIAIVVKPCDSRTINVLLAENKFQREQIEIIGVTCVGILKGSGFGKQNKNELHDRCKVCNERTPVIYDILIGDEQIISEKKESEHDDELARLEVMAPSERASFWLSEFDRCIRCYACRQICPICYCPSCLFEQDDPVWVGPGHRLDEKRAFHLGRAFHLAGRCIGCNECERVCPMNVPIGLLNRKLAKDIKEMHGFQAGIAPEPSPILTIIANEEG